jgi:hypothetical protein
MHLFSRLRVSDRCYVCICIYSITTETKHIDYCYIVVLETTNSLREKVYVECQTHCADYHDGQHDLTVDHGHNLVRHSTLFDHLRLDRRSWFLAQTFRYGRINLLLDGNSSDGDRTCGIRLGGITVV